MEVRSVLLTQCPSAVGSISFKPRILHRRLSGSSNQSRRVSCAAEGRDGGEKPQPRNKHQRRARRPGLFEVEDISPPRQSLGVHPLPPNTHNGDEIDVEGDSYVVQSVVLQYKLVRGKYRQDHRRVEVHRTGRFLYNKFLENMYNADIEK